MFAGYSKIFNNNYQEGLLYKINPTIKLIGIIFLLVFLVHYRYNVLRLLYH